MGFIARFILRGLGMALQKSLPVTAKVGKEAQWLVLRGCRLGHCAGRGRVR